MKPHSYITAFTFLHIRCVVCFFACKINKYPSWFIFGVCFFFCLLKNISLCYFGRLRWMSALIFLAPKAFFTRPKQTSNYTSEMNQVLRASSISCQITDSVCLTDSRCVSVLVCLQKAGRTGCVAFASHCVVVCWVLPPKLWMPWDWKKQLQGALKKCLTFGMSQRMSASSRHVRVCDRLMSAVTASPQRDGECAGGIGQTDRFFFIAPQHCHLS